MKILKSTRLGVFFKFGPVGVRIHFFGFGFIINLYKFIFDQGNY